MDEDKEKTKSSDEHPIWQIIGIVIVLLIAGALFQRAASFFSGRSVSDFFSPRIFSPSRFSPFDPGSTVVGREVSIKESGFLFDAPGGNVVLEIGKEGRGIIEGDSRYFEGQIYFPIRVGGVSGFVAGSGLVFDDDRDFREVSAPIGKSIILENSARVYKDLGEDIGALRGRGDRGIVSSSPVWHNGERYRFVDFYNGVSGYVAESAIRGDPASSNPLISLRYSPVGRGVTPSGSASVYRLPPGNRLGVQKSDARGVVVSGPVLLRSERYWFVDFDAGSDGYVVENSLLMLNKSIVRKIIDAWKTIATILSLIALAGVVYSLIRLTELRKGEEALYTVERSIEEFVEDGIDPRWKRINEHIESENPSDWRLAILEADIILDEMLQRMGYQGETVGERLKSVEVSDFTTIELAWEAHKIRNRIAHSGGDYLVTQREAMRVIGLYRAVFKEFKTRTE